MKETKFISILSKVATVIAICMYVSYIPQIINNLHGNYGAHSSHWLRHLTDYYGASMPTSSANVTGQCSGQTSQQLSLV